MKLHVVNNRSTWLRYVLLAASITTFLLIVVGSIVRVTGAGLSCPDWPTCFGQWSVPAGVNAQIQYAHRVLALFSGFLISLSAVLISLRPDTARWIRISVYGALLLGGVEAILGGSAVLLHDPARLAVLHMALALAVQALVLGATVGTFYQYSPDSKSRDLRYKTRFGRLTILATAAVFLVTVSGVYLANNPVAQACGGWLLCNGQIFPGMVAGWVELGHQLLTGVASFFVAWLLFSAWRRQRTQRVILSAATATAWLFFAQVLVGALKVSRGYPAELVGLHAATSAGLWAGLVVLLISTGLARRTAEEEDAEAREPADPRQRLLDLLILTKPIIVALLLVTTYAGMVVGGKGLPSLALTFWTLFGGALAAGGSGAINQYVDRDLDRNMQRTARRPLAARRMTPAEGLAYGIGLCLVAFYLLAGFVNLLAAVLSLAGMIYYVLIYSIFLKKATVQNIVIGGGAGAIPPMVGWAAVTGSLAMPALFMFAIVFMWTPPHFWALAIVRRKDYERAGVPMLPVVKGEQVTRKQIFIYTLELVGLTLLMPIFHLAGSIFLILAGGLGGMLIYAAWRVLRKEGNKAAYTMYRFSSMYLLFIFAALALDAMFKL